MSRRRKRESGDGWVVTRHCPRCGRVESECHCDAGVEERSGPRLVRLRLEKRRGGQVTVLETSGVTTAELQELVADLRSRCGSGGSVKGDNAELQGDHRERLRTLLAQRGYRVRG